jgi:ectoine hydroxylase-related dioxygenase (phytanoyl-CoA dioxygenase family)
LNTFVEQQISAEDIDRFEKDGAIILRNLISADWINRMRVAIDEVLSGPGTFSSEMAGSTGGRFYGDFFIWRSNSKFRDFIFDSPLAEIAQKMLRSVSVRFFYEQLLVKEPSTKAVTPWHQDLPYWPIAGRQICSVWVPFDRVTPETGVVTYVKGSHLWDKLFRPRSFGARRPNSEQEEYGLEEAPDIDGRPQDFEFVTGVLNPGDVFVHHARTLHGAPANASANVRRRALATRWLGDDVCFEDRPNHFLKGEKFRSLQHLLPKESGASMESSLFPMVMPRAGE